MSVSMKTFEFNNPNQSRKDIHTSPKKMNNEYKIVRTHLLDGIYEGFVNASYQRDGFGILQTDDFQTYIGYFKYNKPHGLGLIVYSDGSMIYANFDHGLLEGIGIADNGHQIQIGTFKGTSLVGIGFQYSYSSSKWKMNSYHKGVSIQIIKQEELPLAEGIPNILTLQSDILTHYINYTQKTLFSKSDFTNLQPKSQNINSFYIHKLSQEQYFFGTMISKRFQGLGLISNSKSMNVSEVGSYRDGVMHGFGIKMDHKLNYQEQGFYVDGKKQGIFLIKQAGKNKISQFKKGNLLIEDKRGQSIESIKKQQKIYYYRQKDFLSTRNNLGINSLKSVFESSEYKAWKIQQQNDKKQKADQTKPTLQTKAKQKSSAGPNIAGIQGLQKTSIQIMKQKITGLISQNESKKNKSSDRASMLFHKDNQDTDNNNYEKHEQEDDIIGVQQSPIQHISTHFVSRKKTVSFNGYENRYN